MRNQMTMLKNEWSNFISLFTFIHNSKVSNLIVNINVNNNHTPHEFSRFLTIRDSMVFCNLEITSELYGRIEKSFSSIHSTNSCMIISSKFGFFFLGILDKTLEYEHSVIRRGLAGSAGNSHSKGE